MLYNYKFFYYDVPLYFCKGGLVFWGKKINQWFFKKNISEIAYAFSVIFSTELYATLAKSLLP